MLQVIRGDVFEFCINIQNIDLVIIEKVVFVCKDFDLEWEAELDDTIYRVRIPGETTQNFKKGFIKYDLVVKFVDGEELTIDHREMVEVLDRVGANG